MDTVSNYTETLEKTVRDLLERQEDLIRTLDYRLHPNTSHIHPYMYG